MVLLDMSDSKTNAGNGSKKTEKRNLPSWMIAREDQSNLHGKKQNDGRSEGEKRDKLGNGPGEARSSNAPEEETQHRKKSDSPGSSATGFSKLMEGVVFVLSGFVNPERSTLRAQALAMGAEYQPDWNSDCTLLVCAFPNTPKYRQVEADCGTIVSKGWISECFIRKKLVDIEQYLMHAGKPWRKNNFSNDSSQDKKRSSPRKLRELVDKGSESKSTASASSKSRACNPAEEYFSASNMKKWATDDLSRTISWLESQEEKPEPSEIKQIAAEGILTCLQDAIDSMEQKQDIRLITEQWSFVPRVVEELAKIEGSEKDSSSFSKEDLYRQAKACKRIYEEELSKLGDESHTNKKKPKNDGRSKNDRNKASLKDASGCDSDETIEMTEEEIDLAYTSVASKFCK